MATPPTPTAPVATKRVKQVLAGDQIVLMDLYGAPPEEKTVLLSNIAAPKLGKLARKDFPETKDEPYAWEAREFLRKKIIGKDVQYQSDQTGPSGSREYGVIFLGGENITELIVSEGLAAVREGRETETRTKLFELQNRAKAAQKGMWSDEPSQKHVRELRGSPENMKQFKEANKAPIPAIIDHVVNGSTLRAVLLPDFYHVSLSITGIRCPGLESSEDEKNKAVGEEAKFFVERCLLHRDIEVVLDSVTENDKAFFATILHPNGNIAEVLLKEGFAKCMSFTLGFLNAEVAKRLRDAERNAKENRRRFWKDYSVSQTQSSIKGEGTVVEIVNGDALMIKIGNNSPQKIFLSAIRPPKDARPTDENKDQVRESAPTAKAKKPLYDIPWLFDAREYLRKKLIGKKVTINVDYENDATENFPKRTCCTIRVGGVNVAEALVLKGLATVNRSLKNDNKPTTYSSLLDAEEKARKSQKGMHGKLVPSLRVTDVSSDAARARTFLSSFQRSGKVDAIVEYVSSGSRLRLYIPKEACLATFLLGGINCPRPARPAPNNGPVVPGEPFGDEALIFTRDRCMQREVEVKVDYIDKVGNFIGWLWIEGVNLAVALVEEGLASVHFSAEKSEHFRALKAAEDAAKAQRIKLWTNYVEEEAQPEEEVEKETTAERKVDYQSVVVTEATSDLRFYVQTVDQGPKLEALMTEIRQEFHTNPPLPGAYSPRRGDLCAAKFSDDLWYRARVEKIQGGQVHVFYIDYGNREVTSSARCASLPGAFTTDKPYANEFTLAFVKLPSDVEYQDEAIRAFREDVQEKTVLLNVEYKIEKTIYASLTCPLTKTDIGKGLVADGLLMLDPRREKRLQKIVAEYRTVQDEAKKQHKFIWQYGDITEDDAKEFGLSR